MSKSIDKTRPPKHHYIPVFFLKGFTNAKRVYFLYDKYTKKIHERAPDNSFYESDGNTLHTSPSDELLVEKLFSGIESELSQLIRESGSNEQINSEVHSAAIDILIEMILWRIPALRTIANQEWQNNRINDNPNQREQFIAQENDSKLFDEYSRLGRVITFVLKLRNATDGSHGITRLAQNFNKISFGVSDNPVLFLEPLKDINNWNLPMFFPISKNKLILSSNSIPSNSLTDEDAMMLNYLLLHQAERYFAHNDRNVLSLIVKGYNNLMSTKGLIGIELARAIHFYKYCGVQNEQRLNYLMQEFKSL